MTRARCTVMPACSSGLVFLDETNADSFIKSYIFKYLQVCFRVAKIQLSSSNAFLTLLSASTPTFNLRDMYARSVHVTSPPPLPLNSLGVTLRFGLTWQQRTQSRVNLESFCCCKHIALLHHHPPPTDINDFLETGITTASSCALLTCNPFSLNCKTVNLLAQTFKARLL